ncbi:MAG: RraA family protein, partial [Alphaproteobacteria bacterium]|nr:RraA family protein [Alphaproteobacteria bacterium]
GSFRDVPDSARGFNLIGGKVGPSHAFVHLVDIDCQVTVHGLTAKTNDIIHADQHGAVFIPPSAIAQIPAAVDLISRREAVILETAKSPDFTVEKLKIAMGQMKDIH